jgi:hypothetical protein
LKISPADTASEVEEDGRDFIRRDLGDIRKYQDKHQASEEGLENIPGGTKNRLLVAGDEIPVNEAHYQFPVIPDLFPRNVEQAFVRLNDSRPLLMGNLCVVVGHKGKAKG